MYNHKKFYSLISYQAFCIWFIFLSQRILNGAAIINISKENFVFYNEYTSEQWILIQSMDLDLKYKVRH